MVKNNLFEFDNVFDVDCLIGTDEAGRGPGAGGVFASAVCFKNADENLIEKLSGLNDSKKLSKKKREELYNIILENTINSTVCVEVEEIEKINILNASLKAMGLACKNVIREKVNGKRGTGNGKRETVNGERETEKVGWASAHQEKEILVLVDGNKLIKEFLAPQKDESVYRLPFTVYQNIKQQCIIKGDGKSASIAAASILAKVSRDRYMEELDKKYPQYNWKQNAGYLTAQHLNAIEKYGTTPHHRQSFLKKFEARQLKLC